MKQIRKAARKVLRILPAEIYEFKKQVPRLISKNFHDNKWVLYWHIAVRMLHLHMSGKNQDIYLEYSKAKLYVIRNIIPDWLKDLGWAKGVCLLLWKLSLETDASCSKHSPYPTINSGAYL